MFRSFLAAAGVLALVSSVSAQSYPDNYNANCVTNSDIVYQNTYSYATDDTMDFGFYTQSSGTCDAGSYALAHMVGPDGQDYSCGYVALDGNINLVSCANLPRNSMKEGAWTIYWETVPSANQYSWNSFTVSHSQSTVTVTGATSTITTTPVTVITTVVTVTPTDTTYLPQVTVTTPSATQYQTINITPPCTTITTTSTSTYTFTVKKYAVTTATAQITAPCRRCDITPDKKGTRPGPLPPTGPKGKVTKGILFDILNRLHILRIRGDVPNTVGVNGQPLTKTVIPDAVVTTVTAPTSTNTVTSTSSINGGTITITNPTPTTTVFSGVQVSTTTITLPQETKSIIKSKATWTMVTSTVTYTITKKVVTTPICDPTPVWKGP